MEESLNHCTPLADRPPWATHRIVYSIYAEFENLPTEPPGKTTALCVPLDRDGMPTPNPRDGGNGRPRPPKRRTIDLRVGDQILSMGKWRTIRSIAAYRAGWLTQQQADGTGRDGYIYRLPPATILESCESPPPPS